MKRKSTTKKAEPNYSGSYKNVGESTTECPLSKENSNPQHDEPEPKKISIRARLFFDGTLNNRTNTEHRLGNTDEYSEQKGNRSYENDYTNISKLEQYVMPDEQADHSFSIYVEGIGTQDSGKDKFIGYALGMWKTGVKAKVEIGIQEIINEIESLKINKLIEYIHLDAFGFSRGAAGARYFIYSALKDEKTKLMDKLTSLGYSVLVDAIKVKFIGLYDTVASYGLDVIYTTNDDTSDLKLDSITEAETVVQLVAADEHRKKFPLTNIKSAGKKGIEKFLPGAHSDVGGGYIDDGNEFELEILDLDRLHILGEDTEAKARFEKEKNWLIQTGWYTEDEIHEVNFWNELKVIRTGIKNTYNRIPMQIMVDYAKKNGMNFNEEITDDYPVPKELNGIKTYIDRYLESSQDSTPDDWNINTPEMKKLRHDYLHFSAYYGDWGVNEPEFTNNDNMNGQRKRVIHNG